MSSNEEIARNASSASSTASSSSSKHKGNDGSASSSSFSDSDQRVAAKLNPLQPGEILDNIRGVFASKTVNEPKSQCMLRSLVVYIMNRLDRDNVTGRIATEIYDTVLAQLDVLHPLTCIAVVEFIINAISSGRFSDGKCLQLLPKLLVLIGQAETIPKKLGENEETEGPVYRDHLVAELSRCAWPNNMIIPLATVFRDISMSSTLLENVVLKLLNHMGLVELQELPPLTYQLLLLATKGSRSTIVRGIFDHFNELDKKYERDDGDTGAMSQDEINTADEEQLVHVEGTVILHINIAVKQDQELGNDIIKILKGSVCTITPFEAAMLLSISRIHRLESKAFDLLKKVTEQSLQFEKKRRDSLWIRSLENVPKLPDIGQVLKEVIRRSARGWDHIVAAVVGLGFILLDTARAKTFFNTSVSEVSTELSAVGIAILERCFRAHESVRGEILQQILSRVVTAEANAANCIEMLGVIVSRATHDIFEAIPKIKEAVEYLGYMNSSVVSSLLRVLSPLMTIRGELHDYVVLILRKAMFAREESCRDAALAGFLQLLENVPSLSAGSSQQASDSEQFCLEVLSHMRRCLSQQHNIRKQFYQGVASLVSSQQRLVDVVLEILIPQLRKHMDDDEGNVPIKLSSCVDAKTGSVTEPLAYLLHALQSCVSASTDIGDTTPVLQVRGLFSAIISRMANTHLEEFEMDKTAEFNTSTVAGLTNISIAKLLVSILEVLIQYAMLFPVSDAASHIDKLFQLRMAMLKVLKEKSSGKGKRPASNEKEPTLLSLECTQRALEIVSGIAHQAAIRDKMRSDYEIQAFFYAAINKQLAELKNQNDSKQLREFGVKFGPLLFREVGRNQGSTLNVEAGGGASASTAKKSQQKASITSLALECCSRLVTNCVTMLDLEGTADIVAGMWANDIRGQESVQIISAALRNLREPLKKFCSEKEWTEACQVATIMSILTPLLEAQGHRDEHLTWIQEFCKTESTQNAATVKGLTKLYFQMSCAHSKLQEVQDIAGELKRLKGAAESNNNSSSNTADRLPMTQQPHFEILISDSEAVTAVMTSSLQEWLDEIEWLTSHMNAVTAVTNGQDNADLNQAKRRQVEQVEQVEQEIVQRLHSICRIMQLVTTTELTPIPDALVETLIKLYKVLWIQSKRVATSGSKVIPRNFHKMIEFVGRHLNEPMYDLLFRFTNKDADKTRIVKQGRLVPSLVFEAERFESALIRLSKSSGEDLSKYFKRSTSRDFKIMRDKMTTLKKEGEENPKRKRGAGAGASKSKKKKKDSDGESDGD